MSATAADRRRAQHDEDLHVEVPTLVLELIHESDATRQKLSRLLHTLRAASRACAEDEALVS